MEFGTYSIQEMPHLMVKELHKMDQDKLEFYYRSKHAHSLSRREKEEEMSKLASDFTSVLKNFAINHPKAVESGITGGILGAGSELVMPSRTDQFGAPSTNLGEIAKRGLLGAALGAAGGEIKTQVRNHVLPKMAQEEIEKIKEKTAGLWNSLQTAVKPLAKNTAVQGAARLAGKVAPSSLLEGAGKMMVRTPTAGGAVIGGLGGLAGNALSGEDHALGSTLAGAGLGALGGKAMMLGNAGHNPLFGKSFGTGVRNELKAGLKTKVGPAVSSPSLQNAPSLDSLVADSGVKNTGPAINPRQAVGPSPVPQKPQEIDWTQKQRPV